MKRVALTWIVFDVLLAGAGLLVLRQGTGGFLLSALMLALGVACGLALLLAGRWRRA